MVRRLHCRLFLHSLTKNNPISYGQLPKAFPRLEVYRNSFLTTLRNQITGLYCPITQVSRSYTRGARNYDLFGNNKPGDAEFRKAWEKEVDDDSGLWTGSDDDDNDKEGNPKLEEEIKRAKQKAKEHSDLIDGDDSDELRSIWSDDGEERTLWTGSECDDDDDVPTEAYPNEKSDAYIDKLFEFEEKPKYRTISELLKDEKEPKELSPGKQARKLAVENALKKLKKGPDGRYTNVWEVMTDIDILIGAFENIISGPEYAELREGGPKKTEHGILQGYTSQNERSKVQVLTRTKTEAEEQTCFKKEVAESPVSTKESTATLKMYSFFCRTTQKLITEFEYKYNNEIQVIHDVCNLCYLL